MRRRSSAPPAAAGMDNGEPGRLRAAHTLAHRPLWRLRASKLSFHFALKRQYRVKSPFFRKPGSPRPRGMPEGAREGGSTHPCESSTRFLRAHECRCRRLDSQGGDICRRSVGRSIGTRRVRHYPVRQGGMCSQLRTRRVGGQERRISPLRTPGRACRVLPDLPAGGPTASVRGGRTLQCGQILAV